MSIAEMRTWFDILQDKANDPYFTDAEKDEFLEDAQWDIINEIIGDYQSPTQLERSKTVETTLSTLVKSISITTDGSGLLTTAAVDAAVGGTAIYPLKISRETLATGSVTLSGTSGSITGITVNSVQIMSGTEAWVTSLAVTATNIADNITAFASSPNYTATASGAVITIRAATGSGTTPNGFVVTTTESGGDIVAVDINMAGGSSTAPAPAKFVRHNDIDKFQENTYKAGVDSAPLYTISNVGWQTYASTVANVAFSIIVLVAPTAVTDLPVRLHRKQVAKAMTKTGLVTEAQALTLMEQTTNG